MCHLNQRQPILSSLEHFVGDFPAARIVSLHGRFYAMDRNKNWDRTQVSYMVLTDRSLQLAIQWREVLTEQYAHGLTDEFIVPTLVDTKGTVRNGDGIIFL